MATLPRSIVGRTASGEADETDARGGEAFARWRIDGNDPCERGFLDFAGDQRQRI